MPPSPQESHPAKSVHIIGCGVLRLDLTRLAQQLDIAYTADFLKGGLHEQPAQLRQSLQDAIDHAPASAQRIIVGYGLCGRGTVGVHARKIPLVIPRVQDCIALFLGSDSAYRRQFKKLPGTYYISAGWYQEKVEPLSQHHCQTYLGKQNVSQDDLVQQYGPEKAQAVWDFLNSWQKNYQRAAFVDTGADDDPAPARHAQQMAQQYGWKFERLPGDTTLLKKLLTAATSDPDILVVPPQHVIDYDAVAASLQAVPVDRQPAPPRPADPKNHTHTTQTPQAAEAVPCYGLGIDAGGTYTDAVIYDLNRQTVLAKTKALTTRWNFTLGIQNALDTLDPNLLAQVRLVSVSTTLATNAIVEGQGQKVGLLVMPPYGLFHSSDIAHEPKAVIAGRLEIDGQQTEPINEAQIRKVAQTMLNDHHVKAFAVSGFAGAINPAHELAVKHILVEETSLAVTCGHELSALLNFRTRAQTAVLNARIIPRLEKLLAQLENVLHTRGLNVPVMVVKGDGTLIASQAAQDRPVETILSGPAASVAGAQRLTHASDALVVDIGGTTTDTAMLRHGAVRVCEDGTTVGAFQTHVRALQMRTTGLGGDSLIAHHQGALLVGPRRVAPVAWAASQHGPLDQALDFLARRLDEYHESTSPMQLLVLTTPAKQPDAPGSAASSTANDADQLVLTPAEQQIVDRLTDRPYSLDELAHATSAGHWSVLRLARLEEYGLVQRCGLTPTDLLHVRGDFLRWDADAARRLTELTAQILSLDTDPFIDRVLDHTVRQLALELLKRQLDEETNPDAINTCPVCQTLLKHLLDGPREDFSLTIHSHRPVIGIGAPAAWFIPRAAALLNAEAIIPDDADVANAIGAITSNVVVRHQVRIKPDGDGGFLVEGLPDAPRFDDFDQADHWARNQLQHHVRQIAHAAGAHNQHVHIDSEDDSSTTADGHQIFIGRTLAGTLTGLPLATV